MNFERDRIVLEHRHQENINGLERKRMIKEAFVQPQQEWHILAPVHRLLHLLRRLTRIRIHVSFDYSEPRPGASNS